MTQTIENLLAESPLFKDIEPQHVSSIASCASNARFHVGDLIFREGSESGQFHLLRAGKVSLEISAAGRGPIIIQTVEEGDLLGWSSMVPPYRKHFDARVVELTRTVSFDSACVRKKCEEDPKLGYVLLKSFSTVIASRLQATRLQLLDFYGTNS